MADNITKLKTMVFRPGAIILGMSEEAFGRHSTGEVATYRGQLRRKAPFPDCEVEMTAGYITYHRRRLNETEP